MQAIQEEEGKRQRRKEQLRAKDIRPFYPQNPRELKKSPGSEKTPVRIGSMSQAKLTQRNMKVLRVLKLLKLTSTAVTDV